MLVLDAASLSVWKREVCPVSSLMTTSSYCCRQELGKTAIFIPEFKIGTPVATLPGTWGRYHGGRWPSIDDSPTLISPSALDKPSIMKRYHHWWMCSHTSPHHSPTMVMLHGTRFVKCRWWDDGWTVKTVVTWWSSASMIPAPGVKGSALVLTSRSHVNVP